MSFHKPRFKLANLVGLIAILGVESAIWSAPSVWIMIALTLYLVLVSAISERLTLLEWIVLLSITSLVGFVIGLLTTVMLPHGGRSRS